jgi:hypothetical protein
MLYGFTEIKDDHFMIRCAIKFYINVINAVFVCQRFFYLESGLKWGTKLFLFDFKFFFFFFVGESMLRFYFISL